VDTTKEKLRKIRGQVFHVVAGNNQLLRLRVGTDGKISLEKRIPSLNLESLVSVPKKMLEAGKEAREKLEEVGKEARGRARRKWRKVVTGDPEKRIRDHMKEVPQVKMIDKISFTFGVLCICGSEWLALRHPEMFPLYYYMLMGILLAYRWITYSQDNYQLFMLDFCYFVNFSVVLQTSLYPGNLAWFKANYILTLGPITFAIVIWKNSLVFHSLDKLTSFFLHAFPPLTMHLLRWGLIPNEHIKVEDLSLSMTEVILLPLGVYSCWQLSYWFVTEGVLKSQLDSDPTLITSIRYLASDKKNAFRNLNIKMLLWLGVSEPGEELSPDCMKTKVIFAMVQLFYTVVTILPTYFLFDSYLVSCTFISIMYSWGTWNGASYYIEVFAERYRLQFKEIEEEQELVSKESACADSEEEDEDEDFQNALEEIDESSDLYKTIVAAIIEDSNRVEEKKIADIVAVTDDKVEVQETKKDTKEDTEEDIINEQVPLLLEEAAIESVGKRSSNASSESNGQWEELEVTSGDTG